MKKKKNTLLVSYLILLPPPPFLSSIYHHSNVMLTLFPVFNLKVLIKLIYLYFKRVLLFI